MGNNQSVLRSNQDLPACTKLETGPVAIPHTGCGDRENLSNTPITLFDTAPQVLQDADTLTRLGGLDFLIRLAQELSGRFMLTDDFHYIRHAISTLRRALQFTSDGHGSKPYLLYLLGTYSSLCFDFHGSKNDDLDLAVTSLSQGVKLMSTGYPKKAGWLNELGNSLRTRFEVLGTSPDDIEASVSAHRSTVTLTPDGDPLKVKFANDLGRSLLARYDFHGDIQDLEESLSAFSCAFELDHDQLQLADVLVNIGNALQARFKRFNLFEDLETAAGAHFRASMLIQNDNINRPYFLRCLGQSWYQYYLHTTDAEYLERAIELYRCAFQLTPDDDSNKAKHHTYLDSLLALRFRDNSHPNRLTLFIDLDKPLFASTTCVGRHEDFKQSTAIDCMTKTTSDDDLVRPVWLSEQGSILVRRFERTGKLDDLERAVLVNRSAVELISDDHPDKPMHLFNLGNCLFLLFLQTRHLCELDQAILVHRCAVELTPDSHPDKSLRCINFGDSLSTRFERTGQIEDLEQAVLAHRRAVELTPDEHSCKPRWLNTFGTSLFKRFECTVDDLDARAAFTVYQRALEMAPEGHPERPSLLMNLGNLSYRRFWQTRASEDLEMAISFHFRAAVLTPDDHPDKPVILSGICNARRTRFERFGNFGDIMAAVLLGERAIQLTPDGHSHLPSHYNALGLCCLTRHEHTGTMEDLEQAVNMFEKAVALIPDSIPALTTFLENLGRAQEALFKHAGTQASFDTAAQSFTQSILNRFNSPYDRLDSANYFVIFLAGHPEYCSAESHLAACWHIIATFSELTWLGNSIQRRYTESSKVRNTASTVIYVAISANALALAVEWLEASRAFIWSQISSLRAPIDELQECHPRLADSLRFIRQQLQLSAHSTFTPDLETFGGVAGISISTAADRHRLYAIEYDKLLKKIRQCPRFENFLRPKKLEALLPSLRSLDGPVVFINVDRHHCDALLLHPGGAITSIRLSNLSEKRAVELCRLWTNYLGECKVRTRGLGSLGDIDETLNALYPVLECTWTCIVQPILKALNFGSTKDGRLPHITWCPTEALTQLPLHAAGIYQDPHGPRVYDFVISSYTTSLSVLVDDNRNQVERPCSTPAALVVTQPDTPGYSSLPATVYEGVRLQQILASSGIESKILNDGDATLGAVRDAIHSYPWVHFACHGSQNAEDVTQSAFALYDGPLTLRDLMGTASDNAELAFLSACQTAVGDEKISEESAHLAAGMLAVGFKGVVATMWSIMDADAPIVVEKFYTELLSLRNAGVVGKGQTGAAYALHEATKVLREKVGERNFMRWAPFVHFGV